MELFASLRRNSLAFGLLVFLSACGGDEGDPGPEEICGARGAPGSAPDWARDGVVYEVFVRSFADSDGDGVGDLRGLMSRLDYLNDGKPGGRDLGVDALWLMPIFRAASYHGYDTTDYEQIDPAYGTLADFEALADLAHARGIRIILDLVLNHTSSQHPWFQAAVSGDAQRRGYYVWSANNPGWTQPWLDGGAAWHAAAGAFYYGVFWSGMPDLNYTSPAVRQEMIRVAKLWLDRGADGFRLDAVRYLVETGAGGGQQDTPATHAFWKEFRAAIKAHRQDAFLVGEAWADARVISGYYGSLDEFDANFDFPLKDAIISSIQARNHDTLANALCQVAREYPAGALDAVFLGNHDLSRLAPRLENDVQRLNLAAALQLTLPGTPFIYYGEEIGMKTGNLEGGDINFRTPMLWSDAPGAGFSSGTPWLPINAEYLSVNVERAQAESGSLLQRYRALLGLRRASTPLRRGSFVPVSASAPGATGQLFAFVRSTGGEAVAAAFNFGRAPISGIQLDLSGAGLALGALRDALSGVAAPALEPANAAAYPIGELPAYGFRLLASAD